MTLKTLASIPLALILYAIPAQAFAKSQVQSSEYDRHSVSGGFYYGVQPQQTRQGRATRVTRVKIAKGHRTRTYGHPGDGHRLVAQSGAQASVSTAAMPHFRCLLGKLETVGYKIQFMGGYASRGNASAHPTGNALDINQTSRNRVTHPLPPNATEMARDCGLVHGAVWSSPDQGHFEMPQKYGYVFHHRRARYASAR